MSRDKFLFQRDRVACTRSRRAHAIPLTRVMILFLFVATVSLGQSSSDATDTNRKIIDGLQTFLENLDLDDSEKRDGESSTGLTLYDRLAYADLLATGALAKDYSRDVVARASFKEILKNQQLVLNAIAPQESNSESDNAKEPSERLARLLLGLPANEELGENIASAQVVILAAILENEGNEPEMVGAALATRDANSRPSMSQIKSVLEEKRIDFKPDNSGINSATSIEADTRSIELTKYIEFSLAQAFQISRFSLSSFSTPTANGREEKRLRIEDYFDNTAINFLVDLREANKSDKWNLIDSIKISINNLSNEVERTIVLDDYKKQIRNREPKVVAEIPELPGLSPQNNIEFFKNRGEFEDIEPQDDARGSVLSTVIEIKKSNTGLIWQAGVLTEHGQLTWRFSLNGNVYTSSFRGQESTEAECVAEAMKKLVRAGEDTTLTNPRSERWIIIIPCVKPANREDAMSRLDALYNAARSEVSHNNLKVVFASYSYLKKNRQTAESGRRWPKNQGDFIRERWGFSAGDLNEGGEGTIGKGLTDYIVYRVSNKNYYIIN